MHNDKEYRDFLQKNKGWQEIVSDKRTKLFWSKETK